MSHRSAVGAGGRRQPASDEANRRRVYGQNFFKSAADAARFAAQLGDPVDDALVIEIGSGSGRITTALARRGHQVVAVEIDRNWQRRLAARNLPRVSVIEADFLDWEPPNRPLVAIGNLPFGSGTAILRRCLDELGPRQLLEAVFLMQVEYVAKRVGRYGGNLFNAQWWPWYEFDEGLRFSRYAFDPVPQADTATILIHPRRDWELHWGDRAPYQNFVGMVFNTGHALIGEALRRATQSGQRDWLRRADVPDQIAVKQLSAGDWVSLYLNRPGSPTRRPPTSRRR